jgi:hypothetical protein
MMSARTSKRFSAVVLSALLASDCAHSIALILSRLTIQ